MNRTWLLCVVAAFGTLSAPLASATEDDVHARRPAVKTEVELVAVGNGPIDERGWWGKHREKLEAAPVYKVAAPTLGKGQKHERDEMVRIIVVKAKVGAGAAADLVVDGQKMTMRWPHSADGKSWDELKKAAKERGRPFDEAEFRWFEHGLSASVVTNRYQRFIDARVRIARGEWKQVAVRPRLPHDGNDIEFDLGAITKDGVEAYLPQTQKQAVRVRAEDKKGELHAASFFFNIAAKGTTMKFRTRFKLPAADIVAFHLEARPYEYHDVKNIPLYPADIRPVEDIRISGGIFARDRDVTTTEPDDAPSDLDWIDVHDDDLPQLARVTSLRRVCLMSDFVSVAGAQTLAETKQLRHVRVLSDRLTDDALVAFGGSSLQSLELQGRQLREVDSAALAALANTPLTELKLWDTELTDEDCAAIAKCKTLKKLVARGRAVSDEGLASLVALTELTELDFGATACTNDGFAQIAKLRRLTRLNVTSSQIDDDAVPHIVKLPSLERINLAGTRVTNAGVRKLGAIKTLTHLDARDTRVTSAAYKPLREKLGHSIRTMFSPKDATRTATITVVDEEGEPVANADVWLVTDPTSRARSGNDHWGLRYYPAQLGKAKTDAEGRCEISFEAPRQSAYVSFWAVAPDQRCGLTGEYYYARKGDLRKQIKLSGAKTDVQVMLPDGEPAANVDVYPLLVQTNGGNEIPASVAESLKTKTDADGRATITGFAPQQLGNLGFSGEAIGHQAMGYYSGLQGDAEEGGRVVVHLQPTTQVAGSIASEHDADLTKLHGVVYTRFHKNDDEKKVKYRTRFVWSEVDPDEFGEFTLPHLGYGFTMTIERSDATQPFRMTLPVKRFERDVPAELNGKVVRVVRLQGILRLTPPWDAVGDHEVHVRSREFNGNWALSELVQTDRSGRFTAYVMPEEASIRVSRFYVEHQSIDEWQYRNGRIGGYHRVPTDRLAMHVPPLDMAKSVEVQGTWIDTDGKPVVNRSFYGYPAPKATYLRNSSHARSNKKGEFTMLYPETHPPVEYWTSNDEPVVVESKDPLVTKLLPKEEKDSDE